MPSTQLTPSFFHRNRQTLRRQAEADWPIIITANGLLQRNNDSTFPFRQDSNFWYLTGINEPDIILVLDGRDEYCIVPGRTANRQTFDGEITFEELSAQSGVKDIVDDEAGWERLAKRLRLIEKAGILEPSKKYVQHYGMYTNPARARLMRRLKRINDQLVFEDLRPVLSTMRSVKQPAELELIQRAIDVTAEAFDLVSGKHFSPYGHEYEVEAAMTQHFRQTNLHHAYQPIVAGGGNACTLHYINNDSQLTKGDILLIDAGAECQNYAADITRSYALKQPTKRQLAVHAAVLEIQKFGLEMLKPGVRLHDYEEAMARTTGEQLLKLGLIKEATTENIRHYFPHAATHFLGLDVHDVGDYNQPLLPNMVLTIEPGIYIPEEGIGIRIEDDVQITDTGVKVLSDKLAQALY